MLKRALKKALQYRAAAETAVVREMLDRVQKENAGRPFCPPWEGDLIHFLISRNRYSQCLETGFGTGSTALYMLHASDRWGGRVTSIDWSADNFNHIGKEIMSRSKMSERHTLIEEPSLGPMARLLLDGAAFDFVFIDGWKTFDYLAYEVFIINRLLRTGGCLMFDDTYLPAVQKIISMLVRHYGYQEIDYRQHGQPVALRLFQMLTTRRLSRPYRAFKKTMDVADQHPTRDWTFFRRF